MAQKKAKPASPKPRRRARRSAARPRATNAYDVYVRPERRADGNVVGVACVVIELDLDSSA